MLVAMGLLDGDIANLFAGVFGQFYLDGTLTANAVWVPDGSGGGSYQPGTAVACKVQEDQVDEATRVAGGYSQDDVRFLILQTPGVVVTGIRSLRSGVEHICSERPDRTLLSRIMRFGACHDDVPL